MALPNPCCCCNVLMLVISNSNLQKDDNFTIKLNGFTLGTINNAKSSCTGRIWVCKIDDPLWPAGGDPVPSCVNVSGIGGAFAFCNSGSCDFEPTLTFSVGFLNVAPTPNVLEIWIMNPADLNNNNNAGSVKLLRLSPSTTSFDLCSSLLSEGYGFGTPSGGDLPKMMQSFSFLYSPTP